MDTFHVLSLVVRKVRTNLKSAAIVVGSIEKCTAVVDCEGCGHFYTSQSSVRIDVPSNSGR